MQLNVFALLASAVAVVPILAQSPSLTILNYDAHYDDPKGSLSTTECSANAGILHGYHSFGDIPNFPYIAGSFIVEGYNSTNCGTCYELTYNRADGTSVALPFTIVNSASGGFISSVQGVQDLTGLDRSTFPGNALISFKEVPSQNCGF